MKIIGSSVLFTSLSVSSVMASARSSPISSMNEVPVPCPSTTASDTTSVTLAHHDEPCDEDLTPSMATAASAAAQASASNGGFATASATSQASSSNGGFATASATAQASASVGGFATASAAAQATAATHVSDEFVGVDESMDEPCASGDSTIPEDKSTDAAVNDFVRADVDENPSFGSDALAYLNEPAFGMDEEAPLASDYDTDAANADFGGMDMGADAANADFGMDNEAPHASDYDTYAANADFGCMDMRDDAANTNVGGEAANFDCNNGAVQEEIPLPSPCTSGEHDGLYVQSNLPCPDLPLPIPAALDDGCGPLPMVSDTEEEEVSEETPVPQPSTFNDNDAIESSPQYLDDDDDLLADLKADAFLHASTAAESAVNYSLACASILLAVYLM